MTASRAQSGLQEGFPTLALSSEVASARDRRQPVVALESTLIAHGLPWPENLETAREAERLVRSHGATPATVAVLDGQLRVGLHDHDLLRLARTPVWKASRRDLATAVACSRDAATTVSATAFAARAAGILVMATGGLGGVHRQAARTFDVSADLDELAHAHGLLVVCSGVKTILDVPATLEYLETRGIPVLGYQTSTFPAFTCLSTNLPLESRADDPEQAARIVNAHRELRLPGAVVLAQPVPSADALDSDDFESALQAALAAAESQGLSGKALTPFLLDQIRRATEGRSLRANRSLILANAGLAARVAVQLARLDPSFNGGRPEHPE